MNSVTLKSVWAKSAQRARTSEDDSPLAETGFLALMNSNAASD